MREYLVTCPHSSGRMYSYRIYALDVSDAQRKVRTLAFGDGCDVARMQVFPATTWQGGAHEPHQIGGRYAL